MSAERPGFPFRIFLPLAQLLLWLGLLWPYLPAVSSQLKLAVRELSSKMLGTEPPAESATIVLDVTPFSAPPFNVSVLRLTAPAALNVPVGFIQVPFMLDSPSKSEWAPTGMPIRDWRAVSWPFVGTIFWWIAGRALESLSAGLRFFASYRKMEIRPSGLVRPPLHWIEVAIGATLMVVGGAAGYTLASGRGLLGMASDYVMAAGAGLWAVLGLMIVFGGLLQWRVRQIEGRDRVATTAAL